MAKDKLLIVRLREVPPGPDEDDRLEQALVDLTSDTKAWGVQSTGFLVTERDAVRALRARARRTSVRQTTAAPNAIAAAPSTAQRPDVIAAVDRIARYAHVEITNDRNLDDLVEILSEHPAVERAFVRDALAGASPALPFLDGGLANQEHLRDAATYHGIDAFTAWCVPGGLGEGAKCLVVDVGGWEGLETGGGHPDLAGFTFLTGFASAGVIDGHGTEAAGTGFGRIDDSLAVGVAPQVATPRAATATLETIDDILIAAGTTLAAGDVVVIPLAFKTDNRPLEMDDAIYDEIVALTQVDGIVVVEGAGNNDLDLDWYVQPFAGGKAVLSPIVPPGRDSGAILVGGSEAGPLHQWALSNHGARVSVFSWAQDVWTSAFSMGSPVVQGFGGTSSASCIIGGACVVLQSIKKTYDGVPYTPTQLRTLMSDPTLNTPAVPSTTLPVPNIGVQPNLASLIANQFGFTLGDAYVRDNVADVGIAHSGPLSSSPDILYTTTVPLDPDAAWGAGSGHEDDYVGGTVQHGIDHYMYLRVFNRGTVPAYDVVGNVYWSEVSTLPSPSGWHHIGTVGPVDVPPVGPQVLGPVTWAGGSIPAPGHYCFVATIRSRCEEEPTLSPGATWNEYVDFIRAKNGAVWRNFNVPDLSADEGGEGGFFRFPFEFGGAFDRPRRMQLELHTKLARGARATLVVPIQLGRLMRARRPSKEEILKWHLRKDQVVVDVKEPRVRLVDALLGARSRGRIEVIVEVADRHAQRRIGEVVALQRWEKRELGRVTWRLLAKPRAPDLKQT